VNLVTAHEPDPTARDFVHRLRTRHGVNVIYSDRSVFASVPVLQALRRNEVIGMQIDPWGQPQGAQTGWGADRAPFRGWPHLRSPICPHHKRRVYARSRRRPTSASSWRSAS
jgi:hypothetical protein